MKVSLIDLAFLSEKRKDVLLLLEEGPKTGDEIKTALNVNSTSIMPQIKKLKEGRLIVQDERITIIGQIMTFLQFPNIFLTGLMSWGTISCLKPTLTDFLKYLKILKRIFWNQKM